MSRRIVQFGTSRFLQAHADLFVHEARAAGQAIGPITVVKTTARRRPSGPRCWLPPGGRLSCPDTRLSRRRTDRPEGYGAQRGPSVRRPRRLARGH